MLHSASYLYAKSRKSLDTIAMHDGVISAYYSSNES